MRARRNEAPTTRQNAATRHAPVDAIEVTGVRQRVIQKQGDNCLPVRRCRLLNMHDQVVGRCAQGRADERALRVHRCIIRVHHGARGVHTQAQRHAQDQVIGCLINLQRLEGFGQKGLGIGVAAQRQGHARCSACFSRT